MATTKRKGDGEKGRKKKKAQVSESSSSDSSSSSSSDSEDEFSTLGLAPEQLVKVRRLSAKIDRCKDPGKQAAMQARLVKFLGSVAAQQHRQEAALKPAKPVATLVAKPAAFNFSAGSSGLGAITLTPQEVERRKQRMQRFEASEAEAAGLGSQHRQVLHDVSDGLGSCETLEKEYLRLTSLPRATDVRPPRVLQAALKLVKARWRENADYKYACEQLKSIRQDLTVQHIRDSLAVDAYETHARIALEMQDLAEFNQCHAVLKTLYDAGATGNHDEFLAYGLLYALIACSFKGMGSGTARQALCSELISLALPTTSQRRHNSPAVASPASHSPSLLLAQPHLGSLPLVAEPSSSIGAPQGSGKKRRKATEHTQPSCKRTGDVAVERSGPNCTATQPNNGLSGSHRGTKTAAAAPCPSDADTSEQGNGHCGDTGAALSKGRAEVLHGVCVSHACAVVGAFRLGDWGRFIGLYGTAPRMIPYLMDHMLPAVRAYALQSLITAHRPLPLPTSAVLLALGFDTHEDTVTFCTQHGAALIEGGTQIDTRASGATRQ